MCTYDTVQGNVHAVTFSHLLFAGEIGSTALSADKQARYKRRGYKEHKENKKDISEMYYLIQTVASLYTVKSFMYPNSLNKLQIILDLSSHSLLLFVLRP